MKMLLQLLPALLAVGVGGYALFRGTDVFSALTDGALQGLRTVGRIAPVLVCLLPAVGALRASGAIDAFTALLRPALSFLGIPPETVPLMLLRPMSGSGALAVAGDIFTSAQRRRRFTFSLSTSARRACAKRATPSPRRCAPISRGSSPRRSVSTCCICKNEKAPLCKGGWLAEGETGGLQSSENGNPSVKPFGFATSLCTREAS